MTYCRTCDADTARAALGRRGAVLYACDCGAVWARSGGADGEAQAAQGGDPSKGILPAPGLPAGRLIPQTGGGLDE